MLSVISTNEWVLTAEGDPIRICKQLTAYFPSASVRDIYHYLQSFGMYGSAKDGIRLIRKLQENNVWGIVQHEFEQLQQAWNGPNIPIFIFPSDPGNELLIRDFNGKSGLAYKDKLFLFISPQNTEREMKAILTHEYNHVCRLSKYEKPEDAYVLLDSIILEGLAEWAVYERMGEDNNGSWLSLYSNQQLANMWKELVYPKKDHLKKTKTHHDVLYGFGKYPKMAGYCVGYYLVKMYVKNKDIHSKDLLDLPSALIAQLE
ncbi:DUF2268 domain-containing protein [Sporosarcina luteola]|uniref:DUF2268 domain-containing protein n=1 Tax=Sporosarcina luteola TaxID=582850 RepID=UPI0028065577|nr:DUF2268 domain-containing protein [Sporosarcina luteola]